MEKRLSRRLGLMASFVLPSSTVMDVGSDHALLPIHLINEGISKRCYAVENKEGPYSIMRKAVNESGLSGSIRCVFADGLSKFEKDIDTIVLAGMGGSLIVSILSRGKEKIGNVQSIIVDSHKDTPKVREYIISLGYYIDKEEMIEENGIFYDVMRFRKGTSPILTKMDLLYGPLNIKDKPKGFLSYLNKRKDYLLALLQNDLDEKKKRAIEEEIKDIETFLQ